MIAGATGSNTKFSSCRSSASAAHARSSHFPGGSFARASTRLKRWVRRGSVKPTFISTARNRTGKLRTLRVDKSRVHKVRFLHPRSYPDRLSGILIPRSPARHEGRLTPCRASPRASLLTRTTPRDRLPHIWTTQNWGAADRSYSVRRNRVVFGQRANSTRRRRRRRTL